MVDKVSLTFNFRDLCVLLQAYKFNFRHNAILTSTETKTSIFPQVSKVLKATTVNRYLAQSWGLRQGESVGID